MAPLCLASAVRYRDRGRRLPAALTGNCPLPPFKWPPLRLCPCFFFSRVLPRGRRLPAPLPALQKVPRRGRVQGAGAGGWGGWVKAVPRRPHCAVHACVSCRAAGVCAAAPRFRLLSGHAQVLLNYCNWVKEMGDPSAIRAEDVRPLYDAGFMAILPGTDRAGRRIRWGGVGGIIRGAAGDHDVAGGCSRRRQRGRPPWPFLR